MTLIDLIIRVLATGLALYFIVSEARYITSVSDAELYRMFLGDPILFVINNLKYTLIFIALPILYFLKLFDFFWDKMFQRRRWGSNGHGLLQAKIFYKAVYIIIFTLIIIRLIGQVINL